MATTLKLKLTCKMFSIPCISRELHAVERYNLQILFVVFWMIKTRDIRGRRLNSVFKMKIHRYHKK